MAFLDTARTTADRVTDWVVTASLVTAPAWVWTDWIEWGLSIISMLAGLYWIFLKIRRERRESKSD